MKKFYPYFQKILLLSATLIITFVAQANTVLVPGAAVPDNSIDINVDKASICEGESISIFLATSETGVEYQLKSNGTNTGTPLNGTGAQIHFELTPSATATYSITATNTTTLETVDLTETVDVTVLPGPNLTIPVNSSENMICKGEGSIISIDNTQTGFDYLLNNGPDDFPPARTGNGGTIQFPQVFPISNTTYRIYVSGNNCSDKIQLTNSALINVAAAPKTDLAVSANHLQICPGEEIIISVDASQVGVDYEVFDGSSYVAGPVSGTGGTLNFTLNPTSTELYTVRAFKASCLSYYNLDQKVMVTVGTEPRKDINLSIDKTELCIGESALVSLDESETGVEYQLSDGTNPVGAPIVGDGNSISFPQVSPIVTTTYSVKISSTSCSAAKDLDNTVSLTVYEQPDVDLNLTPTNADICSGESISIFVELSETDVTYQLSDGTSNIGSAIVGTGGNLEFIVDPTTNTIYEVHASKSVCSTISTLNLKSDITVSDLPNLNLVLTATPAEICDGEITVIGIENSEAGVNYQLKDATGPIGTPIVGNGGAITFPDQTPTNNTSYFVDAIKTECQNSYQITNQADVIVNPQPKPTVSLTLNPSTICEGEISAFTINSSETGIIYEVFGSLDGILGSTEGNGSDMSIFIKPPRSQNLQVQARSLNCASSVLYPNSVSITVNPGPKLDLNVLASEPQICESLNVPVIISVENSENGLDYWLKDNNGTEISSAIGNGGTINFTSVSPNITTTYIVETTMPGCNGRVDLKNKIDLAVIPLPDPDFKVRISEPEICVGENTIISIDTSEIGVNYQLFDGTYLEADPIAGTGSAFSFPEFSPFRSVTYQVIATNEICGTSVNLSETVRVDVGLQPETHLHPTIDKHTVCEGEEVIISLTPTDTRVSYQLLEGDTPIGTPLTGTNVEINFDPTIPTVSTTYRIEAMGERCLDPIDIRYTVDVEVHHQPDTDKVLLSDSDTICAGEEIVLSIENSETDIFYQLYDGTNIIESNIVGDGTTIKFPSQYPNDSKTYSVYAHEAVCTTPVLLDHSKFIFIPDLAPFSVESFATPSEICEGESIDIEIPNTIDGIRYTLQNGTEFLSELTSDGSPVVFENVTPNENSNLQITVGNCKEELVVAQPDYTLQSNPKLQILTSEVQSGYDGNLVISVSEGLAPYTYIISPGETITSDNLVLELSGLEAGTYQVLVVDGNACRSSEAGQLVDININEELQVIVNNALTPNGDGYNDEWILHYDSELGNPEVYIFNIYGQEIYHSKSYQNDWKGTFNGSILPNGAYYYLIEFESKEIKPIKGSLSILGN